MSTVIRALVAVALTVPVEGIACLCAEGLAARPGCCCDAVSDPDLCSTAGTEVGAPCCCRAAAAGSRAALAAVVESGAERLRAAPGVSIPLSEYARDPSRDPAARVARAWFRPPSRAPVYVEVLRLLN